MTIQERIDLGQINSNYKKGWKEGTVDEFITDFPIFKTPFEQICGLFNGDRNSRVAILKSTKEDKHYQLILFTEKREYYITVKDKWICGGCSNRYNKPLEDWTRGRDLGDGDCTEDTLNKILFRIIGCELVIYDDDLNAASEIMKQAAKHGSETNEHKHNVGGIVLTLGLTVDQDYTVTLQDVDSVPCVCLHTHSKSDGYHWSTMDKDSLATAIPVNNIIKNCAQHPAMVTEETRQYIK